PVGPPVAGATEQVTLFVAYDDTGVLLAQSAHIPLPSVRQQRAEELLRSLLALYLDKASPHPLPPGSDIRSVYLVDPGLAVIDINAAFADGHRSGVLSEELTVASLIETLSANLPGILRVKILVEGKQRDTLAGHADLSGFFDVSAVHRLSTLLESGQ
ncbi:MAG: GerMN domain-containing protein, partial [Candidatus Sulfotelmatobacter sp.]